MECLSESVCLFEAGVHPHQSRPSLAPSPDLDKDEVPCLSGATHLVPVPHHHRLPGVGGTDNLETIHALVADATLQEENVDPDHVTLRANLLRHDVDRPG